AGFAEDAVEGVAHTARPPAVFSAASVSMDLATLFGVLLAWGAVLFSMWHVTEGAMGAYFKPPELFLVFGGALGAAMLSMPLHNITGALGYVKKWLFNKEAHIEHVIKEMVSYAETARRDGVLALE